MAMMLIGENLNVIAKKIGEALKERDPGPIREMAEAEVKAGVDLIDINLGPARKAGPELMAWVVKFLCQASDESVAVVSRDDLPHLRGLVRLRRPS